MCGCVWCIVKEMVTVKIPTCISRVRDRARRKFELRGACTDYDLDGAWKKVHPLPLAAQREGVRREYVFLRAPPLTSEQK